MAKVLIIISTGFEEMEAVTIIDILRRANIEVVICTINDILTVGAHGIVIQANQYLKNIDCSIFDMVILPGGGVNTQNLAKSSLVKQTLQQMKNDNKFIGAICAAPYALHEANVLNTQYTCYPNFEEKIDSSSYKQNDNVVIDGKVITSKGPATTIEFSLTLVKLLTNDETLLKIKKSLLVKP